MRTSNIRLKMHIKGAAADFAYADGNGNWSFTLSSDDFVAL